MANTDTMISWFEARRGQVTYSMGSRLGPNSYDCSSAVYFALIAGGFLKPGTMGNTDKLFSTLEKLGWKQTATPKRGDIFIWGKRGASDGAGGRTGVFVDANNIIHCSDGSNGITEENYEQLLSYSGNIPNVIYSNPYTQHSDNTWETRSLMANDGPQLATFIFHENITNTQGENGGYSHQGSYAMDFSGGRPEIPYYAPCDVKCVEVRPGAGIVAWESLKPVKWANGTVDYISFWTIHDNNPVGRVGKIFKKNDLIGRTGVKGYADGDHCHLETARGKYQGDYLNNQGVWCIKNSVHNYDVYSICNNVTKKQTQVLGSTYPWRCNMKWVDGTGSGVKPNRKLSKEETMAWNITKFFKAKGGYSDEAIAAILGNIQAESDFDPAISERGGGPGYGLPQWTSTILGESGADYVTRLMRQAGITGSIKDWNNQCKLIDYGMTHGQWIGVYDPTDPEVFKKGKNVEQLTIAFMKNFERAGAERTSERVVNAKKWLAFIKEMDAGGIEGVGGSEPNTEEVKTLKNAGEITTLGIKNGKAFLTGWHFSTGMPRQDVEIYDAETEKLIHKFTNVPLKNRADVKEKYSDVPGVELSGFELSFELKAGQVIFVKGIRTDGRDRDELIFNNILIYEPVENAPVDTYADCNRKFFFEIYDGEKLIKRGTQILNELSWSNELMYVPTTSIVLPIEYAEYFTGRQEVKIYINNKVFHGITSDYDLDKVEETITVNLDHIINEWTFRQVSTNLACKNRTINDIFSTLDFRYSHRWHLDYLQNSSQAVIDYVYSRQDKLAALTKTCELTNDIWWRVGFNFGRKLEFGSFGDKKDIILSTNSKATYRIIEEPKIDNQFDQVVNIATVYGEKSDSGMSSMSLREVYLNRQSQIKGFPVKVLKKGINNERGYEYINLAKIASNNDIEYTVIDESSIKAESNIVIEASYSFNDLSPFATDDEKISDEDRAKACRTAYETAVKRLKNARRRYYIDIETTELPYDLNVGDRVRLMYDNKKLITEECSEYQKDILSKDDWFYVLQIDYNFDKTGLETNRLRLSKDLSIERDGEVK